MKQIVGFPLAVNFPICMAPMVGLSHLALRAVAASYLPRDAKTIWPSEMLNSRRVPSEDLSQVPEAMKKDEEHFWVPQILGNEEKFIKPTVEKLKKYGASGIDINMGCPVTKALKHNYGVALMGDFDYAAKVVDMTVRNTDLPVSVKLRAGFQKDQTKIVEFVKNLETAGASWITLHPRTAEQKRRGSADWSQINAVKQALRIPVIGNGDVETAEDALLMMRETGCDMVMVGRAMVARPWMLWQMGHELGWSAPIGREGLPPMTAEEEGREFYFCALQILKEMEMSFRPVVAIKKFQFYIRTAAVWLEFGHTLFSGVTKAKTFPEIEATLHQFFSQEQRMTKHTELRI